MPRANLGCNHKILKLHSAGERKKASGKRLRSQGRNALDTIAFACLASLFISGINFLL